jgi:hypothetical protein
MRLSLAGIVASYVLIAVLLLSLNLASRWHWGIKAVAIAITAGFFGVFFVSVTELIGWPTEARVPDHFQLHWATIVEPDKLNGLPSSIYLWVEALDENNMLAGTPRAFRVPYSRELADRIGRAKERIEQGADQAGTARDIEMPEGESDQDRRLAGMPPRQGEPGSTGDPAAFVQHMPSIEFEDMPPPALPPKQPL